LFAYYVPEPTDNIIPHRGPNKHSSHSFEPITAAVIEKTADNAKAASAKASTETAYWRGMCTGRYAHKPNSKEKTTLAIPKNVLLLVWRLMAVC
jgi:hypothetical protein